MEKKNEYIDKLLQNLQSLEAKVTAIKQEESVPFSFFRDAFQKGQEAMHLLHELEMLQIEEMKHQMEKLVLFLSESKNRKPAEEVDLPTYVNPQNGAIQTPLPKLDVKLGLSLNDRFYFQRELFDNNRETMNATMIALGALDNYGDAERYLREKTSWDFKDERVNSFLELLKKGFE